jgi:Sec-independent protein translocase protein TatA
MNIFGVGGAEFVLILVIMLIVAGPKRMIRWSYLLGQAIGKARTIWSQVAETLQKEFDNAGVKVDVPKDLPTRQSVGRMVEQIAKPIVDPIATPLNDAVQDVKKATTLPTLGTWSKSAAPEASQDTPDPAPSFGTWAQSTGGTSTQAEHTQGEGQHGE